MQELENNCIKDSLDHKATRERIDAHAVAQEQRIAQMEERMQAEMRKNFEHLEHTLTTPMKGHPPPGRIASGSRAPLVDRVPYDDSSRESLSTTRSSRASSVPVTKLNRMADAHKEEVKKNAELEQALKSAEAENIHLRKQVDHYGSFKKPLPKPRKQKLSKKTEKSIATHKENIANGIEFKAKSTPSLDDVNQTVANPGGLRRSARNLGRS